MPATERSMSLVDTAWLRMDNEVNLMMIVGVWLLTPAISQSALRERIAERLPDTVVVPSGRALRSGLRADRPDPPLHRRRRRASSSSFAVPRCARRCSGCLQRATSASV